MPIRIPTQTIILQRNGNRIVPPLGKPFDFTQEELNKINKLNPDAVRHPVNESAPAVDAEAEVKAKAEAEAKAKAEAEAKAKAEAEAKAKAEAEAKAKVKGGKKSQDDDEL